MSMYDRGRTMPPLPPAPLPRGRSRYAPVAVPVDTPSAAYTLTCDSGHCDAPTVAVVKSVEGCWLSMCASHAAQELEVL